MRGVYRYKLAFSSDKKRSKKEQLIEKYEEIFKKVITRNNLSGDESNLFMDGFRDISKYIVSSVYLFLTREDPRTPLDKKLKTLYSKYRRVYHDDECFHTLFIGTLEDLVENELYRALGYGEKSEAGFRQAENGGGDFISYVQKRVYYSLIVFLENEVGAIEQTRKREADDEVCDVADVVAREEEIEKLFKEKGVRIAFPEDLVNEVKLVMLGKTEGSRRAHAIVEWLEG